MVDLSRSDEIERWPEVRVASLGGNKGQNNLAVPPEYDKEEQVAYHRPSEGDPTLAGLDGPQMPDGQHN